VLVPKSSGYVGLANLGSELETCVGSRVHLVGVFISFEKNFYRLPFTPPFSGSPYRSFNPLVKPAGQTSLMLLHLCLQFFGPGFVDQPRNTGVF
jgi:hypothetical protein